MKSVSPGGGYEAMARYYDALSENMDYAKRTEYLCTLLCHACRQTPGGLLLDLACGTGTYTYALLERGWDVIGVDASIDMLNIALAKAFDREIAPPLLLCQPLEALDLYSAARAAVCLTDSINHLYRPAQLQRFFKRLAHFLDPGAPFIFDVNTEYKHAHILGNNTFVYEHEPAGVYCVWQNTWLPQQHLTQLQLDLFAEENGCYTRTQERFCERCYSHAELERMLRQAGFTVEHVYGELTQCPPETNAQRVFYVVRKEGAS
ncbi:MAG: class I SAM-dependent methyltransferase [Oscillospiraceae bacterium]|jgi:SAM-dependent methyltransferase|nr:class I SAM-dependent methyltransferase [Oscillospiraceae bacterium]